MKPTTDSVESVFDLSPAEKLQLVEELWDDLAAIPSDVPVADWQLEELDRRKANLKDNPTSGLCWDDVKRRISNGTPPQRIPLSARLDPLRSTRNLG